MEIPTEIVSAVVIASGATLAHNTWKLRSMSAFLAAHVKDEKGRDAETAQKLQDIEDKLPNGEVEKTFNMVRRLFNYYEVEIAEWESTREEVEAKIREKEQHGV